MKQHFYYHVFSTKLNLHFKVPAKQTCSRCDELQAKIVPETNDPERRGEFELKNKLHLTNVTIKKNYPLYDFRVQPDYLETIIYGFDPL